MAIDSVHDEIRSLIKDKALNLGCGNWLEEGMINCDAYDDHADMKMDCRELAFPDESIDLIHNSNVIEHFDPKEADKMLQEWKRVLKVGGYVVISLPDIEMIIRVMSGNIGIHGDYDDACMHMFFGRSWDNGMGHKWGYTRLSLIRKLEMNGFKVRKLYRGYPVRPTPNFTVFAEKVDAVG
jgi:predicted SAM-dependent methyltransferase